MWDLNPQCLLISNKPVNNENSHSPDSHGSQSLITIHFHSSEIKKHESLLRGVEVVQSSPTVDFSALPSELVQPLAGHTFLRPQHQYLLKRQVSCYQFIILIDLNCLLLPNAALNIDFILGQRTRGRGL